MTGVTLVDNTAKYNVGGCVLGFGGRLTITRSNFTRCTADANGGAIAFMNGWADALVNINGTAFIDNTATNYPGGALYLNMLSGSNLLRANLTDVYFSGNLGNGTASDVYVADSYGIAELGCDLAAGSSNVVGSAATRSYYCRSLTTTTSGSTPEVRRADFPGTARQARQLGYCCWATQPAHIHTYL